MATHVNRYGGYLLMSNYISHRLGLIRHGSDAIAKEVAFVSVLQTAAGMGRKDTVGLLIERGANVNAKCGAAIWRRHSLWVVGIWHGR